MKLIIFDADGTLRKTKSGAPAPQTMDDWELLPGVAEYFDAERAGVQYGIASNQAGVTYGYVTEADAFFALSALAYKLKIPPLAMKMEVSADRSHPRRKPNPGMLEEIIEFYREYFEIEAVLFVGDRDEDAEAARRAGVQFCWADNFFGRNGNEQSH